MPKVSVTCVTYNSEKFITGCLNSLKEQTFKDYELIIVDNDSKDKTVETVAGLFPEAKLTVNERNEGYCKAQNKAIMMSGGEYIVTLNPDIELHPDFLKEMVSAASSDPKTGSVSPKLLILRDGVRTGIIDSIGHFMEKSRYVRNIGAGENDRGQYDRTGYVFGVSGAAPLHKRSMLESIRYKDEFLDGDFFMGYDDADIDWRAKLKGWRTVHAPKAVAWHIRSASAKKASRMWTFCNYRNRYLMMIKNDSLGQVLKDILHILIYETGMFLTMAVQLQLIPVIAGVIREYPKMLAKRTRDGEGPYMKR